MLRDMKSKYCDIFYFCGFTPWRVSRGLQVSGGVKRQRPLWGVQGAKPFWCGVAGGVEPPKAEEKHHLIALKIRLETHILVLSAAAVAAEVAEAAAAALPASDIP